MQHNNVKGFTLIEILIVIGLIALLAAVVIVAINPGRQFAQARDAQRMSNANTILNAVYQFAVDNKGTLPSGIPQEPSPPGEICKTGAPSCTGLLDFSATLTINEIYLVSIPIDPSCPTGCNVNGTGYMIVRTTNNRIKVTAPNDELTTVSVTR